MLLPQLIMSNFLSHQNPFNKQTISWTHESKKVKKVRTHPSTSGLWKKNTLMAILLVTSKQGIKRSTLNHLPPHFFVHCLKLQAPSYHPTLPQPHIDNWQPTPTIASRGGNPQHVCNVVESASDDTWRPAWARPFAAVWIGTSVQFRVSFRIWLVHSGPLCQQFNQ